VRRVASAITPVPGGVGPLTNALLLAHLVRAALGQERSVEAAADPPPVPPRGSRRLRSAVAATVPDPPVAGATRGLR
jgi:hypothetical protein